ncbi:MAG: hypothetical protein ACE5MK_07145 [Acidobacteriota bacterium]
MRRAAIILWILVLIGCGGAVKRRTKVDTPPAYELAKTASLQDLVQLINERYAAIESLSVSSLKVDFVSGSVEKGYLEEYRSAKAYSVAKLPDSIFVNILNPLTNSTVITMAADGDNFQIWVPRENKYLIGKTSVKLEEENPIFNVRPHHLLQGILVERIPVDTVGYRYFLEETQDPRFKYYVVGVIELQGSWDTVQLVRKLWIERSTMYLTRQHYYDSGELISAISYTDSIEVNGMLVNSEIEIERKRENYRIRFELAKGTVKVNHPIKEGAFEVPRPPGAELVVVEEKTTDK